MRVHALQETHRFIDMRLPTLGEQRVFAAEVVHFAMKEAVLPKCFVRLFDKFHWQRGECLIIYGGLPDFICFFAHQFEKLEDDFLFVAEMEVEVARRNSEMCGDMVGGHCDHARLIEEINTRDQNAIAIADFLGRRSRRGVVLADWQDQVWTSSYRPLAQSTSIWSGLLY